VRHTSLGKHSVEFVHCDEVSKHGLGCELVRPPSVTVRADVLLKRVREGTVPEVVAQPRELDAEHLDLGDAELRLLIAQTLHHLPREVARLRTNSDAKKTQKKRKARDVNAGADTSAKSHRLGVSLKLCTASEEAG
jgi:hypothetical protein